MSSVLAFATRQRPVPRVKPADAAANASIIIFPGVRYERHGQTGERPGIALPSVVAPSVVAPSVVAPSGATLPRQSK